MEKNYQLPNLEQTRKVAQELSKELSLGDIILLKGNLGAGKTTFARFLIQELTKQKTEVTSPTFNILQHYDGINFPIFHFDLYRINYESELDALALMDHFNEGVSIIEWPEIANNYIPKPHHVLKFEHQRDGSRSVNYSIFR